MTCVVFSGFAHTGEPSLPKGDVRPRLFGFAIPPGPVERPVEESRVVTVDDRGEPVVAKLVAAVGNHAIVMLPTGRLVDRQRTELTPTDRPFQPLNPEQLARELVESPEGRLEGFQVMKTRHFVYIYDGSDEFAAATRNMLESMYPSVYGYASESLRLDTVRHPDVPLAVIIFGKRKDFERFKAVSPGVMAYYDPCTNFVVMCEDTAPRKVSVELAHRQLISTIAHEGVHQILNNIGVQQRLSVWPMWLSEGLAEYFAPTYTNRKFKWEGVGQPNDLRLYELERYLQGHRHGEEAGGLLVEHTVLAARLTSTGYASAWALTHYLIRNRRQAFHRYVARASRLGALEGPPRVVPPGITPENLTVFKSMFTEDLPELENQVLGHVGKLPYADPFADSPHFLVRFLESRRNRVVARRAFTFHTEEDAKKWVEQFLADIEPEQRGNYRALDVLECENRMEAETQARQWVNLN